MRINISINIPWFVVDHMKSEGIPDDFIPEVFEAFVKWKIYSREHMFDTEEFTDWWEEEKEFYEKE